MKKTLKSFAIACLISFAVFSVISKIDDQRSLGKSRVSGSNLRVEVVQTRSYLNYIWLGPDPKFWFRFLNEQGATVQSQRLYVIGKDARDWATWDAPESLVPTVEGSSQRVRVDLKFPSGRIVEQDVMVGVALPSGLKIAPPPQHAPEKGD